MEKTLAVKEKKRKLTQLIRCFLLTKLSRIKKRLTLGRITIMSPFQIKIRAT